MLIHRVIAVVMSLVAIPSGRAAEAQAPVRFAIVGLSHDHARGFIPGARGRADVQLVGIVEPDQEVVARYAKAFQLETNLFHPDLGQLLRATNVQAVATFTSTFEHRRVVEECAARGLTVMMEKPLAVNMEHARAMQSAAKKGGIEILVNY